MICVVIFQRHALDRDALTALLRRRKEFQLAGTPTTEWEAVALCRLKRPDLTILDAALPEGTLVSLSTTLLRNEFTRHVLFLGNESSETWHDEAARMPNTSYLCRDAPFEALTRHILNVCDVAAQSAPETRSPRRTLRTDLPRLSVLTAREIDVLRLLATGRSVRECAEAMNLSVNTVNNHKARMMNKLNVHRTTQLARLAIHEGLVPP